MGADLCEDVWGSYERSGSDRGRSREEREAEVAVERVSPGEVRDGGDRESLLWANGLIPLGDGGYGSFGVKL